MKEITKIFYECEYTGSLFETKEEAFMNENTCKNLIDGVPKMEECVDKLLKKFPSTKSLLIKLEHLVYRYNELSKFGHCSNYYKGEFKEENEYTIFQNKIKKLKIVTMMKSKNIRYLINNGFHHRGEYVESDNDFIEVKHLYPSEPDIVKYKCDDSKITSFSNTITLTSLRDMLTRAYSSHMRNYKVAICSSEFIKDKLHYIPSDVDMTVYQNKTISFKESNSRNSITISKLIDVINGVISDRNTNKLNSRNISVIMGASRIFSYLRIDKKKEIIIIGK